MTDVHDPCNILKRLAFVIFIQDIRSVFIHYIYIQKTIVVVIHECRASSPIRVVNPSRSGHIEKGSIPIVLEEDIPSIVNRDVYIQVAIVVVIAEYSSYSIASDRYTSSDSDIFERAIAIITV